ncbi:hypothetical protein glysoja_043006 [Glycine soja]|uniref:Uncharacterized protein n=1 Tax=Glycine soja TaxID=3848 RepID=A0A0B2SFA9_GLYSO|nr:hypothetical protein glysoja_043006 [Glycine soja]
MVFQLSSKLRQHKARKYMCRLTSTTWSYPRRLVSCLGLLPFAAIHPSARRHHGCCAL